MQDEDGRIHIDTDEARSGSTPNVGRWVLLVGTGLAVLILSLAWIIPALTHDAGDGPDNVNVSRRIADQERDTSTDSIVSEGADEIDEAPESGAADTGLPTVENQAGE